jgi:hypothetical protein
MKKGDLLRRSIGCVALASSLLGLTLLCHVNAQTMTGMDLGTPNLAGSVTDNGDGTTTIMAGGSDIWGTSDSGYFWYTTLSDPVWDCVVRVRSLEVPGSGSTGNAQWGKCELMVRQDQGTGLPEANDAFIAEMTTQPSSYQTAAGDFGVNWVNDQFRTVAGGGADWIYNTTWTVGSTTVSHAYNAGNPAPNYPDRWLRLKRAGAVFTTMDSTDGVNWNVSAVLDTANSSAQPAGNDGGTRFTVPFVSPLHLGIAVTSHDNAVDETTAARAIISDFKITVTKDTLFLGAGAAADNVQVQITDSGTAIFDPAATGNLNVSIAGTPTAPGSMSKSPAGVTSVNFPKSYYTSGASLAVHIEAKNTVGVWVTNDLTVTVPTYSTLNPATKLATPATDPGMKARTFQLPQGVTRPWWSAGDLNRIRNAEQQLTGALIAYGTGDAYVNQVEATNDISTVNFEQNATDVSSAEAFSSLNPVDGPIPNDAIPGIWPGEYNDHIVTEVVTYLRLNAGLYRMAVASDDGFTVRCQQAGPRALQLGSFDGGRGYAETRFEFLVQEAGDYPFRLLWWEGTGGANCEWYMIDRADPSQRYLINGPQANPLAVKAFRTGQPRAYVQSVVPAHNFYFAPAKKPVKAVLVDGATTVVSGSVKLSLNGTDVTAGCTISKVGGVTTLTYAPAGGLEYEKRYDASLTWTESPATAQTTTWRFYVGGPYPYELPMPGSFWIEAEDFDHDSGTHTTPADTVVDAMPYVGGAYDGLTAEPSIDYTNNDALSDVAQTYRGVPGTPLNPYVDIAREIWGMLTLPRPGNNDVVVNYKIGWADSGDWYNYTRTVPKGIYTAWGAFSYDDGVDSPFNQPARISASLGKVTEGLGTSSQTVQAFGSFIGPSPGGWSQNNLVPLVGADGKQTVFKVNTDQTTFRVTTGSGDWDYMVLVPLTTVPPQLTRIDPNNLYFSVARNAAITWTFEDYSTTYNTTTTALKINGTAVPPAQVVTTKAGEITTVTYTPAALYDIGKANDYELSFKDSAGATVTKTGSWVAHFMPASPANMFNVEAEDFNYDSGKAKAEASTMPYLGAAYQDLSATANVDYYREDTTPNGNIYRVGESPNVPMSNDGDLVRARDADGNSTWDLTANYRLGWAGGGRWMNYTRQVPAGKYQVWASMSYGATPSSSVYAIGNLRTVTSDPSTTPQTTTPLGYFRGTATGGWGANQLVPMRASDTATTGSAVEVDLGGLTTFQFEYASSDFDYMMLVPVGMVPPPKFTSIKLNGDGTITVDWTGGGTLQMATAVTGPWQDVVGATSPVTFNPATYGPRLFGRIKR